MRPVYFSAIIEDGLFRVQAPVVALRERDGTPVYYRVATGELCHPLTLMPATDQVYRACQAWWEDNSSRYQTSENEALNSA